MTNYQPDAEYEIFPDKRDIRDFHEYRDEFVTRPPYQRKSVWSKSRKQALLDSLFRRYYIPRLVLREVRLSDTDKRYEVVDGQQRITAVQEFFSNELPLPKTLRNFDVRLAGKKYEDLPAEVRKYADKNLKYEVDIIKRIHDPRSSAHQKIATEIFWRLQQGESLNNMEVAHARLSSPVRNFIVKYSDDIDFDYEAYRPIDENKHKLGFFNLINRSNDRMQHLSLMGRLLLIERAGGPTDVRDKTLTDWIDDTQESAGVGSLSFEGTTEAKAVLRNLRIFAEILKDDTLARGGTEVKELHREYFIISFYMLLRYLRETYAFGEEHHGTFREFLLNFHRRWTQSPDDDPDILTFTSERQQAKQDLEARFQILRQLFFEYIQEAGVELLTLDKRRGFNEAERIRVYRRDKGLCQLCLKEGEPEAEAFVPWEEYETDHIRAWIKGGRTDEANAQVTCKRHNSQKGAK